MALVDNDVLEKLAGLGLFDEFCALDVCSDGVVLLTEARYRYLKGKSRKKALRNYGAEGLARIVEASGSQASIPEGITSLAAIAGIHDVDDGEVQLFSAAVQLPEQRVLTGDKRCIRALAAEAATPPVGAIVTALEGRVMCLEQVVWALVLELGPDAVRGQVRAKPSVDVALRVLFLSDDLEAAFTSYIEDVRRDAAGMLHPLQP